MGDRIINIEEAKAAAEAMLFASGDAVSTEALASVLDMDARTMENLMQELAQQYRSENRGIRIIRLEDAWQMCTDPARYDYVAALVLQPKKRRLDRCSNGSSVDHRLPAAGYPCGNRSDPRRQLRPRGQ